MKKWFIDNAMEIYVLALTAISVASCFCLAFFGSAKALDAWFGWIALVYVFILILGMIVLSMWMEKKSKT